MRTLTSIQSANQVVTNLEVNITPVDQSTTYTFSNWNIQNLTPISYEIDFLGGFGKSSNYQVTLSRDDGLTFWKDSFKKLIKAEVALTVHANSDSFTPHIGVVQDITRFPSDPNLIQLQVFDKFFDNVPQYPGAAIVDSYTGVHPEVSNNNWGYPSYYGKHARPFYMTPVDCNIENLIGAVNISSENHVTSLYFNSEPELGNYGNHLFFLRQSWDQQSGATNLSSGELPFELQNQQTVNNGLIGFNDQYKVRTDENPKHPESILFAQPNYVFFNLAQDASPLDEFHYLYAEIGNLSNIALLQATNINMSLNVVSATNFQDLNVTVNAYSGGGSFAPPDNFGNITSEQLVGSLDIRSLDSNFISNQAGGRFTILVERTTTNSNVVTCQFSIDIRARALSNQYVNYSIYGEQVNCSDIAISENPLHILTDIFSQSALAFRQSQASDTQLDLANSGFNFQCFFGERRGLTDIAEEFGEITATYIYISDSGQINFRTYQESETVNIDKNITPNDYNRDSLVIRDNPLGTTIFDTEKAKRLVIGYNYNFTTGQYENSLVADANNTAACNSVSASGVNNEIEKATQYILEADTASLYLSNLVRKRTQDEQIVEMNLPAQFYELELADVLKLEHAMLENSESVYQITKLKPDYLKGTVSITANQLTSI